MFDGALLRPMVVDCELSARYIKLRPFIVSPYLDIQRGT